jgi:pantoate--beta-alanine ligase
MYPREQLITVDPGPMGQVLEGASRPGFFTGVLTVVLKLFQLVQPQVAVFGEKDAQQLALVRRMAGDLDLGVEIASVPTVRDPDGLAVSSRNSYLSAAERRTALALPRALRAGREAQEAGPEAVLKAAGAVLDEAALATDYLSLADPGTFTPVAAGYTGEALLLAAVRAGATRLIDNIQLVLGGQS